MLDDPPTEWRRQNPPKYEWNEVFQRSDTNFSKECGCRGDGYEEFGSVDRAYGIARRMPRADER